MISEETSGILAGISGRRSCRSYLDTPIPPDVLKSVFKYAATAPSSKNGQPWEVYVLTGAKLRGFCECLLDALAHGRTVRMQNERASSAVNARARRLNREMTPFAIEQGWGYGGVIKESLRFFGAPAAAVLCADKPITTYNTIDVGAFMQNLCLSAAGHGLATCVLGYPMIVEPAIREFLGLPDERAVLITVAIGYRNPDAPINKFRSSRSDIEENVRFLDE